MIWDKFLTTKAQTFEKWMVLFLSFTGLSSLKINWHWQCWLWVIIIRAQHKNRFYTQNDVETKLKKDAYYF